MLKKYIEMAMQATGARNTNQLAPFIGVSRPALDRIRDGGGMTAELAGRFAEVIGNPKIAAKIMEDQAKTEESKAIWRGLAAAFTAIAITLPQIMTNDVGCILCQIARWPRRAPAALA